MNHVPFLATQMGSEGRGIFPKKKKKKSGNGSHKN